MLHNLLPRDRDAMPGSPVLTGVLRGSWMHALLQHTMHPGASRTSDTQHLCTWVHACMSITACACGLCLHAGREWQLA
jgi:hypothetical protein